MTLLGFCYFKTPLFLIYLPEDTGIMLLCLVFTSWDLLFQMSGWTDWLWRICCNDEERKRWSWQEDHEEYFEAGRSLGSLSKQRINYVKLICINFSDFVFAMMSLSFVADNCIRFRILSFPFLPLWWLILLKIGTALLISVTGLDQYFFVYWKVLTPSLV